MQAPAVPHPSDGLKARSDSGCSGSYKERFGKRGYVSRAALAISKHGLAVHVLEVLPLCQFQCTVGSTISLRPFESTTRQWSLQQLQIALRHIRFC
ncbi:hypothetical protein AMTR_s00058p00215090 [Amborella trichopoda]|uniref:Uncharacterized protein n=1 Tax=Amborella trichopoda TaxID=13333 RepID=W1PGA1_AMBTC|nr:hypothetical protein AMTR_s00058p00215090 [Amborella trichopoda]